MLTYVYIYLAVGLLVTAGCVFGERLKDITIGDLMFAILVTLLWPLLVIGLLFYGVWNVLKLPDLSKTVIWRRRP